MTQGERRSRKLKKPIKAVFALLVATLVLDYWLFPRYAQPGRAAVNRGRNGIWLRYTWYFGKYSDADLTKLDDGLRVHGIRDAFFHVRSVEPDGKLRFHEAASARRLNRTLSERDPGLRRFAWVYAGNAKGGGGVNLADAGVRRQMVSEAAWLVRQCGFQGVQWDYETCPDGDRGLLDLLDETREALPRGTPISVAAATWYPWPLGSQGWSPGYFREVAKRCDQIAVMAYDSGLYFPRAYTWWVEEQVQIVTEAARANPNCTVLIGLPTYENGTLSHNPRAENLRLGLVGVRQGLGHADAASWQGVALFADYTTTPQDWITLRDLWPPDRR